MTPLFRAQSPSRFALVALALALAIGALIVSAVTTQKLHPSFERLRIAIESRLALEQMLSAMKSLEQIGTLAQHQRAQAAANQPPAVDPESVALAKPYPTNEAIRIAALCPTGTMRAARTAAPAVRPDLELPQNEPIDVPSARRAQLVH